MLALRPARPSDLPAVADLYRASVHAFGPAHYTPEAVAAWANSADDPAFRGFILDADTLVAEDASGIVGFAGLERSGRIASLYVRPDRVRQGIARRLLDALLSRPGRPTRIWTEASAVSRPVFEKAGFDVVEMEVVKRRGVELVRYVMERREA